MLSDYRVGDHIHLQYKNPNYSIGEDNFRIEELNDDNVVLRKLLPPKDWAKRYADIVVYSDKLTHYSFDNIIRVQFFDCTKHKLTG